MPTKTPIDHSPLDPNDRQPESSNQAPEFPSGTSSGSASAPGGRPITASEVICTTVYQFPELSDAAKEKARNWYRELGPHDDWWEAVYEDFERVCEILGIRLKTTPVRLMGGGTRAKPCIWFSGFWSQGDGACFESYWSHAKGVHARQAAQLACERQALSVVSTELPRASAPAPRPVAVAPVPADAGGMDRDMLRQLILQELRELTRGQS